MRLRNNKAGGSHMKKRILVVDDDSMNLARTQIILGKEYDVLTAESGMDALMRLKDTKVDMVLLDIDMPEMNGIETFERMKGFAPEIPVIFLTASGLEEDVVSAIKLGAVNYLKKPYRPQELLKRISQEFEKRWGRRNRQAGTFCWRSLLRYLAVYWVLSRWSCHGSSGWFCR